VSSPSDHQPSVPQPSLPPPPAAAPPRAKPTTQEIPVVPPAGGGPLPPHPGAAPPPPVQPVVQPTGPVEFVPGPPSTPPPVPQPAAPAAAGDATTGWPHSLDDDADRTATTTVPRPRRDRAGLLSAGLVVLALVLLELGLGLRFGGSESFWSELPLWSAFATVCTALGLAGSTALPGASRLGAGTGWRIAAGGLVGLAVFWVLVVLPVVAGDRGFLLTAALGCLGAALWTGPARRR
jgi:hypothetical protein